MRALDIGSGQNSVAKIVWPEAEVLTLDIDEGACPDFVCDLTKDLPESLRQEQFDAIMMHHVLEHFWFEDGLQLLKRVRPLLKPLSGELHIHVPDLRYAANLIASDRALETAMYMVYGSNMTPYMFHKAGYTKSLLGEYLSAAGYTIAFSEYRPFAINIQRGGETARQLPCQELHMVGITA